MRIQDEIRLSVGALLSVLVLTMVAAVALLARMTPAVDQILRDNEHSIRAVETMLWALTDPAPSEPRTAEFEQALAQAQGNITMDEERPLLEDIDGQYPAALAGDPAAISVVRTRLRELARVNRESMLAANARAKRLGTAGAWALVFLGLIGLAFSLALMRRARIKLINPVYELGSVLEACRDGDSHRRFQPAGASREFRDVAAVINTLVDEHFTRHERDWECVAQLDRLALLSLLDREAEAGLFVCDSAGKVTAANTAGLAALATADGPALRERLQRASAGDSVEGVDAQRLGDDGWLVRVVAPRSGPLAREGLLQVPLPGE
jgi:hypothetical protein